MSVHKNGGRPLWGAAAALVLAATAVGATAGTASAAPDASPVTHPADYVNPFIGTTHYGNTYPGAVTPFGMLSWSPQTSRGNQYNNPAPGGYDGNATTIRGFSLTHLNGVGCSGANGDIPIMPIAGDVTSSPSLDFGDTTYASKFSHANETASAGYYKVGLDNGTTAELTATPRTGTGEFTFPAGKDASMLFRTSLSESGSTDATVTVDPATQTVTGSVTAGNFCGPQSSNNRHASYTLYFTAHFDTAFASQGTWTNQTLTPGSTSAHGGSGFTGSGDPVPSQGSGAYVTFPAGTSHVQAKVAVSYVSLANAEANLAAENGTGVNFNAVHSQAVAAWNKALSAIQVSGGTEDQRHTFYTAYYHTMLEPTLTSDVDGRYLGSDMKVHALAAGQQAQYGTFSGWDQYRAQVQLLALTNSRVASDYAQSMKNYADQAGGEWDRWLLENGKTSVMSGDPAAAAVAGIYAFGGRSFDVQGAFDSLVKAATVPTANDASSAGCNVECVGERPALDQYLKLSYVPADNCHCWGGAAETLEDAAADFGLSQLATALGDTANAQTFAQRAGSWSNVFDPNATPDGGYMRNRNSDGSWVGSSFSPSTGNGFVEGSSARYTWMVYSDVAGLAAAMGGNDKAVSRLDAFFRTPDGQLDFSANDDTRYDPTNEPDINAPYLYDYLGAPAKTQETVRGEMDQLWTNTTGGIPGNDDAGTMSSWYVWSALGMYPQVPTRADLVLTAPLFPRAVVHTGFGTTIQVNAPGASSANKYVQGLAVNNAASTKTWVPASFVQSGGKLDYTLGATPSATWGTAATDAPPSFRDGEAPFFTSPKTSSVKVQPGESATAEIGVSTIADHAIDARWTAAAPAGLTVTPSSGTVALAAGGSGTASLQITADAGTKAGVYTVPLTFSADGGTRVPPLSISVTVGVRGTVTWLVNNQGISADDTNPAANFDSGGWSYSAAALASVGVVPGGPVTAAGFTFTMPDVAPGAPDNIQVGGGDQVIDVTPVAGATKLSFLGSASGDKAQGTVTLTYTDGTVQQALLGFSDWTLNGGGSSPSYGNVVAVQTPYRDVQGGGKDGVRTDLFASSPLPLIPGKTLKSVTLPTDVSGGDLHVFAVATA